MISLASTYGASFLVLSFLGEIFSILGSSVTTFRSCASTMCAGQRVAVCGRGSLIIVMCNRSKVNFPRGNAGLFVVVSHRRRVGDGGGELKELCFLGCLRRPTPDILMPVSPSGQRHAEHGQRQRKAELAGLARTQQQRQLKRGFAG